jgi:hypothetical protein
LGKPHNWGGSETFLRKQSNLRKKKDRLPAIISPGVLTSPMDAYAATLVPALIADAAGWRYVEFFTANIRNPNTRRAYLAGVSAL